MRFTTMPAGPPPAPEGFRRSALESLAEQRDRIRWLKRVYRWNGLDEPAPDDLPEPIRVEEAGYEEMKRRIAEAAASQGYRWPPPGFHGLD